MNAKTSISKIPDLLCIGFFCHDLNDEAHILGGTAAYASLMASKLGKKTAVLTSVGADFEFLSVFERSGIQVSNKRAEKTTVFHNVYHGEKRIQHIYHRAETLFYKDLPEKWKAAAIVKFCLIADEVDFSLLEVFPNALIGATVQGWLRKWDKKGKVSPKKLDWEKLKKVDIVFMSNADLGDMESEIPKIVENVEIVIMTKGANGAMAFHHGKGYDFPSFPTTAIDTTGAGDIFATAFLVHYSETKSIDLSMAFAHSAASFVVEKKGVQLPERAEIYERFENYKNRFL